MTPARSLAERLGFLAGVVRKECRHLQSVDARLFGQPLTSDMVRQLEDQPELAERAEAFASRFGRLQDTLGDKLLPGLLALVGERPASMIDNLDRAERLDWLPSSDRWLEIRKLRNQMVHEYIEDPAILADALNSGHDRVPELLEVADRLLAELERRL